MDDGIGQRLAQAIAEKDRAALADILDPELDFRAMTPYRFWESNSARELVDDVVLGTWFDDGDHIDGVDAVEVGSVADREKVMYRLRVTNAEGEFVVEQQAYFGVEDGRINWLRIMCSGYRPAGATTT